MSDNRSIQVLNISNVNAQGKTVLNDGKLLDLIQKYPFIYNPRVKAYDDPDYQNWAWKNINAAFNCSYANDPNAAFSTCDLMNRWDVLKPLIMCLSKAYDMEAIPQSLRKSVVSICTELGDKQISRPVSRPLQPYQSTLVRNLDAIASLPMDKKLELERDILDLILSSEMESYKATKLNEGDWNEIYHDTEEFINSIGFEQILLTAVSNPEKLQPLSFPSYVKKECKYNTRRKANTLGWVPLNEAEKHVTPCNIRVKRINIEDYLPLAQIIQLNKTKNEDIQPEEVKPDVSDNEYTCIFGL